jgi:hypothetical protein
VVPALAAALVSGTSLLLACAPGPTAIAVVEVPALLREIEVASGCAADYDGWLVGAAR